MSIARQLFHEFRPLFRMLEEPLAIRSARPSVDSPRSLFDDPFFKTAFLSRPAVDLTEEGDKYVVEADLPGVKKENVEVRIGDSGRSVTIEGKVAERRRSAQDVDDATIEASDGGPATAVTKAEDIPVGNPISNERAFVTDSVFSRTVWLPRSVDGANVDAKLNDGVLTLILNKMVDKASVVVPIQ
ncbi:HSP20-like chaperone [Collybia nuda]|uniref:HSP20-like chaperone n=1 Tax=Collybia nuda TaxID=64659 RepID=A0A9P5Y8E3_9AGAR|nr:HSP20-like chaperone [Collybia nuda]